VNKKEFVIICARGGSKGIPNKNIINLNGKPLIAYTIEQSIRCFKNVIVSSDSDEILNVANEYKNVSILKRPRSLSLDNTPKIPVLKHAIETLGIKSNIIIDLQPTSPLRSDSSIIKGLRLFKETKNCDNVVSVSESKYHPKYNQVKAVKNKLTLLDKPKKTISGRNQIPKTYILNGSFFIWNADSLMENDNSIIRKNTSYVITNEYESVDVDTELDLKFAEYLIKSKK
jgi:CMP-N,N'-diacetyllegionaminic acid synthase